MYALYSDEFSLKFLYTNKISWSCSSENYHMTIQNVQRGEGIELTL